MEGQGQGVLRVSLLSRLIFQAAASARSGGFVYISVPFYDALLKIWLGDRPVEPKLKQAMRGEKLHEARSL
jgi:hypothetical protein